MKRVSHLFALLAAAAVVVCGCGKDPDPEVPDDKPQDPPVEEELEDLKLTAPVVDEWVWEGYPQFTLEMENPNGVPVTAVTRVKISTDKKKSLLTTEEVSTEIPAHSSKTVVMTTAEPMDPGFYKATLQVIGGRTRGYTFGISPTQIVSAPDKQDDFDAFWDATIAQLEAVDMNPTLTEIPGYSNASCKCYMVEFQSIADGLTGDPVVIHGYYLEPQDGKKHPVLMHYYGYDDLAPHGQIFCPSGSGEFAEFYLSTRGQIINNRKSENRSDGLPVDFSNAYGDWFAFHFGDRDSYYYRGAFMDCVQGIRFMATRETSDMENIFAEGKSQGGAFSYAAAALSPYPLRAVAPGVAFLGDFPDYFKIVDWPANVAKSKKGSMSDDEMYAFLSYFDTKNLATRITCAVIANSCLQDVTCPPHTNMAPFNNLSNPDKEIHYYATLGHVVPDGWDAKYLKFFRERIK